MRSRETRELPDKSVERLASDTRANVKFKLSCTVLPVSTIHLSIRATKSATNLFVRFYVCAIKAYVA